MISDQHIKRSLHAQRVKCGESNKWHVYAALPGSLTAKTILTHAEGRPGIQHQSKTFVLAL